MSDELIGAHLGRYQIVELIRRGGMSVVYKAYQPALERHVAIKILQHTSDPQVAARFKREARAIAQLQHQNILPIYDSGDQAGLLFLVLQYVEGGVTLGDLLGAPMAPARALRLMVRLLAALEYAHARGIVHRDIKPSNILMPTPDWPMLADFGIVRLMGDDQQRLTLANQIIGTAAYMAPEQATAQPVDTRTDLYAIGVVLYEMLTGRVPFDADTPMSMLAKHIHESPPPPRDLNPNLPVDVEAVLLRALAKDPSQRYQTAAEMAAELERVAARLDHSPAYSQLISLYRAGIQAFEEGHWDQAVERLRQVVAIDSGYEDASDLLAAAQEAQERARTQARQQIELMRQRRQSTVQQNGRPTTASATPRDASGDRATIPTPVEPPRPASRRRISFWAPIAALAAVLLLALTWFSWLRPGAEPARGPAAGAATSASLSQPATSGARPSAIPTASSTTGVAPTSMSMGGEAPPAGAAPTAMVHGGGAPATDTVLPEPPGTLVYEDDFNGDAAAEIEKSGLLDITGNPDFNHGFHPGVYIIDLSQPNSRHWVVLPRFAFGDFSMQIDLWDDSDNPTGDVAQGVAFRVRDDDHLYAALIDPRRGQYSVQKLNGKDTWSDLVAWKPLPLVKRGTDVNQLRIDAAGDTFSIYLNGQMLDRLQDSDPAYAYGMLGLVVANVDAVEPLMHFDNLKIWNNTPAAPPPPLPPVREAPTGNMVLIPGGAFILGSYLFGDASPQVMTVNDFYIDRTEVTNAAYKQCADAGKCTPQSPASDTHPNYANDPLYGNFPATHISWQQARDFCAWAHKRLPTEVEWEKAASWNTATHEKFDWPWGTNVFDSERLNSVETRRGDTTAGGTFPTEINGTVDMAGNVSEWTSSLFKSYPYDPGDGREDLQASGDRVYRGGSYLQTRGKARGFFRRNAPPTDVNRELGFRCAVTP